MSSAIEAAIREDNNENRKVHRFLKMPLKTKEEIYLIYLVPTLLNCLIYILNFSADFVVAIQHFRNNNIIWACGTLAIMYSPAIAYFVLTISKPDWWMTEEEKLRQGAISWFFIEFGQMVAFPLFALYRYAGLLVLITDAARIPDTERTKTLNVASAPVAIELYFFLQAWFQAAPQALLQTHLLFRESNYVPSRSSQTISVQVLCIIMSVIVLAIKTASFQRFESQSLNGRKLPWAMWLEEEPLKLQLKTEESRELVETSSLHIPVTRDLNIPPLPPKNIKIEAPPAPLRGVTSVMSLPVPDVPAPPRPDSLVLQPTSTQTQTQNQNHSVHNNREQGQEEEEEREEESNQIELHVNQKDKMLLSPLQRIKQDLKLPRRKYSTKGLEEDDPVGKFLAFLKWFFFASARVLSIVTFYEFYPIHLGVIILLHYIVMLVFVFHYAKHKDVTSVFVNLWLGFVYILVTIEYRVKFKYASKWLIVYNTSVFIENTLITLAWYIYADWSGFWYGYAFHAILLNMGLCLLATVAYNLLFEPSKRRIYMED